jgi:hypothetical protein
MTANRARHLTWRTWRTAAQFWTLLVMAVGAGIAAEPQKAGAPPAQTTRDQPPVKDEKLRQELLRRMQNDQDARKAVMALLEKLNGFDPDKVKKTALAPVKRMEEIDHENTDRMKQIVRQFGWPGKSLVGADGANAAWLFVQHADRDRAFQKQCLDLLREAIKKGEATGQQLAYLTDRVRVGEKKKQVYGTQFQWSGGKLETSPIEDAANVDKRRKEVGLPPLAEYLESSRSLFQWPAKSAPGAKDGTPSSK